jgi:hypothetical protein
MARNAVWKIVRYLAFKQYDLAAQALFETNEGNEWSAERLAEALAPYWSEYDAIDIGPDARSTAQLQIERHDNAWHLTQILLDPNADRSWHMRFEIDLATSRDTAQPALTLLTLSD